MLRFLVTRSDGVKKRMEFDQPEITLGRTRNSDIPLPHARTSKNHAAITADYDRGVYVLTDTSTNGTLVNGKKAAGPVSLANKDVIVVGPFTLDIRLRPPQATGAAKPAPRRLPSARPKRAPDSAQTTKDPMPVGLPAPTAAEPQRDPTRRPSGRKKRRPAPAGTSPLAAAIACLQQYVEIDEELRASEAGRPCACGKCLLCQSKEVLASLN